MKGCKKGFNPPTKEMLIEEYVNKQLPMTQISAEHNYSTGTIFNYLNKYGIKRRTEVTALTKQKMSKARVGKPTWNKGKCGYSKASEYGGHKKKGSDGYIKVYVPNHPLSTKDGYVMEHILIMEKHIGRYITRDEAVHHINHVRDDNRIENLQLMTFKDHASLHMKERWAEKKGAKECTVME